MSENASYTMPSLENTPANIALWAQASFFFYMFGSSLVELDSMALSSDPDYLFAIVALISGMALLFQVRYSRIIALSIVPLLAILEDPFFLIFGVIWFGPLVFMPALAFDDFGQRPLFGKWTKKGWGTLLLTLFLFFNIVDTGLIEIAEEGQIVADWETDEEEFDRIVADCEASSDCSFLDSDDDSEIITAWAASSMEMNIAYLGLAMLALSIIGLIAMGLGRVNIDGLTPTVAGVVLVGAFWVDDYLWRAVEHEAFGLDSLYLLPVSGVILMSIHGLYTLSPANLE